MIMIIMMMMMMMMMMIIIDIYKVNYNLLVIHVIFFNM